MRKITIVQKIARVIGRDAGPSSFYILDGENNASSSYQYNRCVKVGPTTAKALGYITWRDLWSVIRYRFGHKLY